MAYKSILTVIHRAADAANTLVAAAAVARQWSAHLDVLVLGVDRAQLGYSYLGASDLVVQANFAETQKDTWALTEVVNRLIAAEAPGLLISVETIVTQLGILTDVVAQRARFADLVVLARPYGEGRGVEAEALVEAALFQGNIPVLVVPDKSAPAAPIGQRICLAWNQSPEAMTATRAALPWLKSAQKVDVTLIDPPVHGVERSDPGGALCQMLVRHGVHAEVSVLTRSLPQVADVLARHLWDMNADMLVMGAYGHSRLREAILGGATRAMLERAEVPVLMAH